MGRTPADPSSNSGPGGPGGSGQGSQAGSGTNGKGGSGDNGGSGSNGQGSSGNSGQGGGNNSGGSGGNSSGDSGDNGQGGTGGGPANPSPPSPAPSPPPPQASSAIATGKPDSPPATTDGRPSTDPTEPTAPSSSTSASGPTHSALAGGNTHGGHPESSSSISTANIGPADPNASALSATSTSTPLGTENLTLAGGASTTSDTSAGANPTLNPTLQSAASGSHVKSTSIIAGVIVPLFVLLLAGAAYLAYRRRRRVRDREEWLRTHEEIADAVRQVGSAPPLSAWTRLDNASQRDFEYNPNEKPPPRWHGDAEPFFSDRTV